MKRYTLETREGEFVHGGQMPPFVAWPDVLVFGRRVFRFVGERGWHGGVYQESFTWYVTSGKTLLPPRVGPVPDRLPEALPDQLHPTPWKVGVQERGLGQYSYAILDANDKIVCSGIQRDDALYIVDLVNKQEP